MINIEFILSAFKSEEIPNLNWGDLIEQGGVREKPMTKSTLLCIYKAILMFLLQCAELMAGKAHIPRLTMIRTASKLSTYSMAIMDGKRVSSRNIFS